VNYRKINQKLFLLLLYIITAPFIITLIIPITIDIMMKTRKKELKKTLLLNGFNNYREIETNSLRNYFIFNEDGRFIEVLNGALKFDDIRNYNVELIIPDNSNQSINILTGYIVAGKLGALAGSVTKPCYLILRKKDFQSFKDPVKHVIYGEKSIETLYNLLVFFQEKGYIE
jgi:hypothetical protein